MLSPVMSTAKCDEDQDLADALYLSRLEASKRQNHSKKLRGCQTLSGDMELIMLHLSNDLELLQESSADTLVVIGAPPREPKQSDKAYQHVANHFTRFHRIHSQNLLGLGSTKFSELLHPTIQFRTERRLRNQGFLPFGKPNEIKYLLDLRPPNEDDEAIVLITELSCTNGILTWYKAQKKYGIPMIMVSGQDDSSALPTNSATDDKEKDHTPITKAPTSEHQQSTKDIWGEQLLPQEVSQKKSDDSKPARIGNWEGVFPTAPVIPDEEEDEQDGLSALRDTANGVSRGGQATAATSQKEVEHVEIQPEYSQLRHRSAIERLVHAIEGNDPKLDSAPKVWTFYAVAKFFGCARSERISDWIMAWLFASPNNNFIQCNPEVSYCIGLGIESEALTKDAFSVLVGEKALINVQRESQGAHSVHMQTSAAGRKLQTLDDDELNRIDHAANVFVQRIHSKFAELTGEDMVWLHRSRLYERLTAFVPQSEEEAEIVRELKRCIRAFVRARILWVLARDYQGNMPDMEQSPESVRSFYHPVNSQSTLYNTLNRKERIFTRLFWMALRREEFEHGESSVSASLVWTTDLSGSTASPCPGWSTLARVMHNNPSNSTLNTIYKHVLDKWGRRFQDVLRVHHHNERKSTEARWVRLQTDDKWIDVAMMPDAKYFSNLGWTTKPKTSPADELDEESSGLDQFDNLKLTSPKRGKAADTLEDTASKKRACLNSTESAATSELSGFALGDLPIRSALDKKDNKPELTQTPRTMKVGRLEEHQEPNHGGSRFKYVEREVPIPKGFPPSSSKTYSAGRPSNQASPFNRKEQREFDTQGDVPCFSTDGLLTEITRATHAICDEVLLAQHFFRGVDVPPTDLIDTLMCLNDEEWKYLPLWAGGNDDGTGGVFDDTNVPILEAGGFAGGKRGLGHDGSSSVTGSSNWTEIMTTVGNASKQAADGTATETATVQSLGDVEMEVRSLDGSCTGGFTDTVLGAPESSFYSSDGDSGDDEDPQDDQETERDGEVAEELDIDSIEGSGWDDCEV
jgi:hypothetical protein